MRKIRRILSGVNLVLLLAFTASILLLYHGNIEDFERVVAFTQPIT